mgnify:FL=1
MSWNVEYTNEFGEWWSGLTDAEQEDISATAGVLMERGPDLPFPYSSGVKASRHEHMRELRVQSGGKPLRIFMLATRGARRFCSSVATRPETSASTRG